MISLRRRKWTLSTASTSLAKVVWLRRANHRLEEIADRIAQQDPAAAHAMTLRLRRAGNSLAGMPHIGSKGWRGGHTRDGYCRDASPYRLPRARGGNPHPAYPARQPAMDGCLLTEHHLPPHAPGDPRPLPWPTGWAMPGHLADAP